MLNTEPGTFRDHLKNIVLLSIPTLIVLILILEIFFRAVIPASHLPRWYYDSEESLVKFDPIEKEGLYTIGKFAQQRGKWKVNNNGWISEIDYKKEKNKLRIAVIGDSFIEALQVDVDKSYPSLLRREIGGNYEVYSFGISGAPLSQYLHMSRYVKKHFNPDIFIFNIVHNDFDESIFGVDPDDEYWLTFDISNQHIREVNPKPDYSFVQYNKYTLRNLVLRNSALLRYLYINLNISQWLATLFTDGREYAANIDVINIQGRLNDITKATRYAVEQIKTENPDKRVIFVMDAPRITLYEGKQPNKTIISLYRIFNEIVTENELEYLDLTEPMKKDYELHKIRFDTQYDMHWNEYGHRFVCSQLTHLLRASEQSDNICN